MNQSVAERPARFRLITSGRPLASIVSRWVGAAVVGAVQHGVSARCSGAWAAAIGRAVPSKWGRVPCGGAGGEKNRLGCAARRSRAPRAALSPGGPSRPAAESPGHLVSARRDKCRSLRAAPGKNIKRHRRPSQSRTPRRRVIKPQIYLFHPRAEGFDVFEIAALVRHASNRGTGSA